MHLIDYHIFIVTVHIVATQYISYLLNPNPACSNYWEHSDASTPISKRWPLDF